MRTRTEIVVTNLDNMFYGKSGIVIYEFPDGKHFQVRLQLVAFLEKPRAGLQKLEMDLDVVLRKEDMTPARPPGL